VVGATGNRRARFNVASWLFGGISAGAPFQIYRKGLVTSVPRFRSGIGDFSQTSVINYLLENFIPKFPSAHSLQTTERWSPLQRQ